MISGLPILWFNRDKKAAILSEAFELLKPAGRLQQFTYLGRPPVGPRLLAELGSARHAARHRADESAAGVRLSLRAPLTRANRRLAAREPLGHHCVTLPQQCCGMQPLEQLTIIVPTRNEAANIEAFLDSIPAATELIVVDKSTDGTADDRAPAPAAPHDRARVRASR